MSSTEIPTAQLVIGTLVRVVLTEPAQDVSGVVAGCDSYGNVVLTHATENIEPAVLEREATEAAARAAKREAAGDDYEPTPEDEAAEKAAKREPLPDLFLVVAARILSCSVESAPVSLLPPDVDPVSATPVILGAVAAPKVVECAPHKRVLLMDMNTHVGRAVTRRFARTHEWHISGTVCPVAAAAGAKLLEGDAGEQLPPGCISAAVPNFADSPEVFRKCVLEADVVVCILRDDTTNAAAAIRILANTPHAAEKTFVLVSSVVTWASTAAALKAKEALERRKERKAMIAAGELDPDAEEDAEEDEAGADDGEDGPEPVVFSESNAHERVPHPRYQHWRLLEQAVKFANSEALHTHVLAAGLVYGGGEEGLERIFRAAARDEPLPLPVAQLGKNTSGNVVPTIHVRDLAAAVFAISAAEEPVDSRYILAVDEGNSSLTDIATAIYGEFCDPTSARGVAPVLLQPPMPAAAFGGLTGTLLTTDLRLDGGAIRQLLPAEEWTAPAGLAATITKVADEYRAVRGVAPLRAALVGPPSSGKTALARIIAARYGVKHLTAPFVIAEFTAYRARLVERLRAHRRAARVAALKRARAEAALEARDETADAANENDDVPKATSAQVQDDDEGDDVVPPGPHDDTEPFKVVFRRTPAATAEVDEDDDGAAARDADGDGERGDSADGENAAETAPAPMVSYVDPAVTEAEDAPDDDEEDEALAGLKEALRRANAIVALTVTPVRFTPTSDAAAPKPRYVDLALALMARYVVRNNAACKNQGFLLDGLPKNVRQAATLFAAEEPEVPELDDDGRVPEELVQYPDLAEDEGEAQALMAPVDHTHMVDYALVLDAPDEVLVTRTTGSPAAVALERLYRRLAEFKQRSGRTLAAPVAASAPHPSLSLQSWFRAVVTAPPADDGAEGGQVAARAAAVLELDAAAMHLPSGAPLVSQVEALLGAAHVVHPTQEELVRKRHTADVAAAKAAAELELAAAAAAREAAAEEQRREHVRAIHARRLRTAEQEKREAEATAAIPADSYLVQFVAPTVAKAVAKITSLRPTDPIDALAHYLYHVEVPAAERTAEILAGKRVQSTALPHAGTVTASPAAAFLA